jgi:hypothetical protein
MLAISFRAEVETPDLWTPDGSKQGATTFGGYNVDAATTVVIHSFRFHDKVTGRSCEVRVPAESGIDFALVEDQAATAYENWLLEARAKGISRPPTKEERFEVAGALREFRAKARKRNESSSGVNYFLPAKVG